MKSLMNNKPNFAHKLLVAVLKHTASLKRKADAISVVQIGLQCRTKVYCGSIYV